MVQADKRIQQRAGQAYTRDNLARKRNPYLESYAGEVPRRHRAYSMEEQQYREARRRAAAKARRRKELIRRRRLLIMKMVIILAAAMGGIWLLCRDKSHETNGQTASIQGQLITNFLPEEKIQGISKVAYAKHPQWEENFLTPNEYSRPGDPLEEVNSIFVHYTANPGTSAAQNRSYFEQLGETHERSASAHFIIGYDGEIVQCIPLDEIAYAVMTRNQDSISIECCHKAENGQFTQETYDSLIELLAWLMETYGLDTEDILRHYDCGGKKCPLYYTDHEDAWEQLKRDVEAYTL